MESSGKVSRKWLAVVSIISLIVGLVISLSFDRVEETAAETTSLIPSAPASFSQLVKLARESVVNISTVKVVEGGGRVFRFPFGQKDPFHDFFERYFRDQIPREQRQRSLGSGFIIDKEGYILTNNHVVEKTDEITVKLANEKEYKAQIIGRDPKTDLALIRINADEPLTPLPLGDSDHLEVGDWVIAIGNPFGLGHTVTAGIVSAKYRSIGAGSYDNFIQTDASINPGNSGGPLLNTKGKVVGLSSAIYSRSGGSIGIGFAIPINTAKELLPQLKKGKVVRGWLGVMIQKITPELKDKFDLRDDHGALVADVTKGGPAEQAGLKRGDVITSFDGKKIKEMKELPMIVASTPVNKTIVVEVLRKGKKKSLQVKIGKLEEGIEGREKVKEESDLGMTVEEVTPELGRQFGLAERGGLVVIQVDSGSAAEAAGIKRGDIILEVDQRPVDNLSNFRALIDRYQQGDTILFLIKRRGNTLFLTLEVRD